MGARLGEPLRLGEGRLRLGKPVTVCGLCSWLVLGRFCGQFVIVVACFRAIV